MSSGTNQTKSASRHLMQVNEQQIRSHVEEVVRTSLEETLNGLLEAEADQLCGAKKYERTDARRDTRAGSTSVSFRPTPERSR